MSTMGSRRRLGGWIAAMLVAAPVSAQPPASTAEAADLVADRPGFNAPASVVGAGVVQVELGWSTVRWRDGTYGSIGPQPLLRVGVARLVEVQVASAGLAAGCVADCQWHGTDVAVGTRARLPREPFGVALAATGLVSLPTGATALTSGFVDPLVILQADRSLGAFFEISYNYLFTRVHDEDDARGFVRSGHGVSLGAAAGRWTPFVAVAWRPVHVEGDVPWLAQAGTGFRLATDVQLDVSLDRGLNAVEPWWGVSAGLVVRHRPR